MKNSVLFSLFMALPLIISTLPKSLSYIRLSRFASINLTLYNVQLLEPGKYTWLLKTLNGLLMLLPQVNYTLFVRIRLLICSGNTDNVISVSPNLLKCVVNSSHKVSRISVNLLSIFGIIPEKSFDCLYIFFSMQFIDA